MTGEMLFFSWPSWPFYNSSGSELEKNSGQKTREIKNKLKLFNFTEFKKSSGQKTREMNQFHDFVFIFSMKRKQKKREMDLFDLWL